MERNFKLVIEYDGTCYNGWQRQSQARTIQGEIESALWTMTQRRLNLIGSGRTDAGVHAQGQVANFKCDTGLTPVEFQAGLNSLLPDDIVINDCTYAGPEFHARYAAKSKEYVYRILNTPYPKAIGRQYCWWLRIPLDLAAMQAATRHLLGSHDFKAFEATGSPRAHTVRHIMAADVTMDGSRQMNFHIQADGFLRFMVRNIVGTLVAVGRGKMEPDRLKAVMESGDRHQAGATAPAQGLCLVRVHY